MATQRQRDVAKLIVENVKLDTKLNGGQMLEKVRYGKISKQPSRVLQSKGVLKELEVLGFTEQNAKSVVSEIMLNSEVDASSRLKATDQVFKVQGSYAPEKILQRTNVSFGQLDNLSNEELAKLIGE